jgi:outer membrane protein assembly factor BamA
LIYGKVTGSQGGLNSGIGLVFLIDHRDNVVNATQGTYLETSIYSFTSLLGGDFNYKNFNLVYSQYFPILKSLKSVHILAVNMVATINTGDPPFTSLAAAGNDDILRGYARYRYRDKHFIAGQIEYRFPIWWRIGGVAFTGVGDVFNNPEQVEWSTLKYSYGGGLRFMLSRRERLNLRLDYGLGRNSSSFYISVTEAF